MTKIRIGLLLFFSVSFRKWSFFVLAVSICGTVCAVVLGTLPGNSLISLAGQKVLGFGLKTDSFKPDISRWTFIFDIESVPIALYAIVFQRIGQKENQESGTVLSLLNDRPAAPDPDVVDQDVEPIETVRSAGSSFRSTTRTRAPALARRIAAALPFPIPSPPAPPPG
ncbi:MAG: hypothetical protein HY787_17025 [Deltaproteobacteria bacterium]|nr:hypothetical protein [Deltaproteobacteria bacterium]